MIIYIYISCAGYKNLRSPERLLNLEFRTVAGNENPELERWA